MIHEFKLRVYYEDTDLAGIVYYANYLKFIERARTEYVRELGIDQTKLKATHGLVFAVRRVVADFLSPARFDDELLVRTSIDQITGARIALQQNVSCSGTTLFSANVTLAMLGLDGKAMRLPADIRQILG